MVVLIAVRQLHLNTFRSGAHYGNMVQVKITLLSVLACGYEAIFMYDFTCTIVCFHRFGVLEKVYIKSVRRVVVN